MKFVLSTSMDKQKVLDILGEFSQRSKDGEKCYLAMDNEHPLKKVVFQLLREEEQKGNLPRLQNQVTCNNWSEWATNHYHL